jgi:hypothetical protein
MRNLAGLFRQVSPRHGLTFFVSISGKRKGYGAAHSDRSASQKIQRLMREGYLKRDRI